jgi:LPS-assembly lipoprotein
MGSRRIGQGLAIIAILALAGCGFHPVYAPTNSSLASPAAVGLSRITVALVGGRAGQELREDLQQKFDIGGEGLSKLYLLNTSFSIANDGIAFEHTIGFSTRNRLTASANWTLVSLDANRKTITSGHSRQIDGFNPLNNMPFYGDLQIEQAQSRLAQAVAQDISMQLASYLAAHPPGNEDQ